MQTNATSNVTAGVGINVATGGAGVVNIETHGTVTGTGAGAGGTSGDAIHVTQSGTGTVTVNTFGTVTGNTANVGSDGIDISGGGTGAVLVHTFAAVHGDPAIIVNMAGNVAIITDAASPTDANGPIVILGTTTGAASTVLVDVSANVTNTGASGGGIFTSSVGGSNTINVRPNVTVTGTGAGNSGIAATTATGAITVNIDPLATVTNATGRGITLTQTGVGSATVNSFGTVIGAGTAADPHVNIVSTTGLTTYNNMTGGVVGVNSLAGSGLVAFNSTGGPTTINNTGSMFGVVTLAGVANTINNGIGTNAGLWQVTGASSFSTGADSVVNSINGLIDVIGAGASSFAFGTGSDTLTNSGVVNARSGAGVTFTGVEFINNVPAGGGGAFFNVGNFAAPGSATEFANFSSDAGLTQTVNNSGTFTIFGRGAVPGALNFTGANGSNFNNAGGLINMQADTLGLGGAAFSANAVTLNTTALGGTSDLNYTYTWAGPLATTAYNWNGGANSRIWVDTFLGGPGSTSDRLVVGGNVTGNTTIKVNDTNLGAGGLNLTGITVVAVQGAGANNFQVDPSSPKYANFGPLGAIDKGFFVYPLLYVPGGATTANAGQPNGNAYKFLGVPDRSPSTCRLHTRRRRTSGVRLRWRGKTVRTKCGRCTLAASAAASRPAAAAPTCREGGPSAAGGGDLDRFGLKAIGSWTCRTATADFGQLTPLGDPELAEQLPAEHLRRHRRG